MLDFYADRSPIFMAAAFDADAAAERGQAIGDGTPVHLTIPTDNPWVPLRILGLGKAAGELVEADVYLLTDIRPALLPNAGAFGEGDGLILDHSAAATDSLLADLRSDVGMEWVPEDAWLTKVVVASDAGDLDFDLAIDASGAGKPSAIDAGLRALQQPPGTAISGSGGPPARRDRGHRPAGAAEPNGPPRLADATPRRRMRPIRRSWPMAAALLLAVTAVAGCSAEGQAVTITIHYSRVRPDAR